MHPHRRVAKLLAVDEEGRHSDLDARARRRAPSTTSRSTARASPRCARGSSRAASPSAKTRSTTSGSSKCSYAIRTACRSRSISEADGDMAVKTTDYGFIGVGRMGAHMARRLLKAGISLTVYDTSKEATARARERRRAGRGLGARGREQHRDRVLEPADARHRAEGLLRPHGREEDSRSSSTARRRARRSRASRTRSSRRPASFIWTLPSAAAWPARATARSPSWSPGNAGRLRPHRARDQAVRQAVLLRRRRGPRASHEAREQHHRGRRHRDVGGSHRDGHEGGPKPAADVRHHQRRQRPQQRDAGQVPALRAARHVRLRLRDGTLL